MQRVELLDKDEFLLSKKMDNYGDTIFILETNTRCNNVECMSLKFVLLDNTPI